MFDIVLKEIELLVPIIPQLIGFVVGIDLIRSVLFSKGK